MSVKHLSAIAVQYLKEALCSIYWYKRELKSFLQNCIRDKAIVTSVDWNGYKRQVVDDIVDQLCENQDKYLGDIRRLIYEVCSIQSFKHLEQLEDGKRKAERAKRAVQELRNIVNTHDQNEREKEEATKRRNAEMKRMNSNKAVWGRLEEIKKRYFKLVTSNELQKRGFELEKVFYELFALFDLDPKASFRNVGEQIDGAFTLEGTDYLFEAKWENQLIGIGDLDAFSGKVKRKLDNTLGLFFSVNGFSNDAVRAHSSGRSSILLMNGVDLTVVLEGRIDFVNMLIRKRRHAAQTGEILFSGFNIW